MALGRFPIKAVLDTATNPDDTVLLAAPGANQAIYIQWLDIVVTTAEAATTVAIEDGAGGTRLAVTPSTAVGTTQLRYAEHPKDSGLKLAENTALNATTEGGTTVAANVVGEVVVRGEE